MLETLKSSETLSRLKTTLTSSLKTVNGRFYARDVKVV